MLPKNYRIGKANVKVSADHRLEWDLLLDLKVRHYDMGVLSATQE
jgi:hypothetical protein